ALLLPAVDVRGRTAAWPHERFKQGVRAVGVLAGRQETVHVADDGYGATLGGLTDGRVHSALAPFTSQAASRRTSPPAESSLATDRHHHRRLPGRPPPNPSSPGP